MEFAVAITGVLVGKFWISYLTRWLMLPGGEAPAPTLLLCTHIAVAALTGIAIGLIESRLAPVGRLSGVLSKGLIVGFAWSPWFVTGACVLHVRHQPALATAYLLMSPILTVAALLGGYLSASLEFRLA